MKKLEFLAISMVIAAVTFLVTTAIRNDWLAHTPADTIEDYEEDISFFNDLRSGLCFSLDSYNGEIRLAPCEDVGSHLNQRISWYADQLWYFKDLQRNICMAGGSRRSVENKVPVPCRNVEHLLGPADGRYRYDMRLKRH